jgi:protease I
MGYLVSRGAKVTVVGAAPGLVTAYNSDIQVYVQKAIGDVSADDFDGLVIPGGKSPANLRQHVAIVDFARKLANSGKPVAAICHGPQVLVTAGVMDGKRATCYAGMADELRSAGASYADTAMVRDGNIITSRSPGDLPRFCAALEKALLE